MSKAQLINRSTRHLRVLKDKPLPSPPLRRHCFPQSQPRLLLQLQSPQGNQWIKELNAKLDEENRQQKEDDQLNMTVGEYDEMGTHSQEEPTHQGPVTRSKSVVSEPHIVDAKQAHDIDDIF